MTSANKNDIRAFVVFEPSYHLGCLATLSSMARYASYPIHVDVLMRKEYVAAANKTIKILKKKHGEKIILHPIVVPINILEKCDAFKFRAHFIPEVLFRLYYFDIVAPICKYVIHVDLDMIWQGDIFSIQEDLTPETLLHVVESAMPSVSRTVMPSHITRYINAGLLVFSVNNNGAINRTLRDAQNVIQEIAGMAHYLDQDAINIVFQKSMRYIPGKWNFNTYPVPDDVVVLHATGTRKPWFFCGQHPFYPWYKKEMDLLGIPFWKRYNYAWPIKGILRKIRTLASMIS